MNKEEIRQKREDEYATYKEYNDIFNISMNLNDENEYLQTQLTEANDKLEKKDKVIKEIKKYVNKNIIQGCQYGKWMEAVANPDKLLKIIKGSDNK